jgi:hypothetical protein
MCPGIYRLARTIATVTIVLVDLISDSTRIQASMYVYPVVRIEPVLSSLHQNEARGFPSIVFIACT